MNRLHAAAGVLILLLVSFSLYGIALETDDGAEPKEARSVIFLIGDGMGFAQMTAARWAKADENLSNYTDAELFMDGMEYAGYSSTSSADSFVTDSAAAGTTLATGHKTKLGIIGQDETSIFGVQDGENLTTILELAEAEGKATGVVTNMRITHATPASFYAHVNDRDKENRIAEQFLASGVDVALGGGLCYFVGINETDPLGGASSRDDDQDLLAQAQDLGYVFVYNRTELLKIDPEETEKLLGLFGSSHLVFELRRRNETDREPSLSEMTEKAIEILSHDEDGFFLMVEGGTIDHACHIRSYENTAAETLAFDEAVKAALDYGERSGDTLVVVTSDHEAGGLVLGAVDFDDYSAGVPVFASGLAFIPGEGYNLTPTGMSTHTAVDVPLMASGPGAERFSRGRIDNTEIFYLMKEVMGL
ncbi:alkaline phosphatase [Methanothrix harundinacea]|uniref:Alkaline phosphatase family protein n=1 Tax=Methanothrix harundinacea (strain 6Ac) TaxID=1110509 RepID=G7WKQ6_METH6|nr:alkaline phosphatase [Methanothrix harundinacea]AET63535.1 Alkaline phosphatase family protein [Methanothrix harundinacea 6Ac]